MLRMFEEDEVKLDKTLNLSKDEILCYISKIHDINTFMRITVPRVFSDNLVSFEIFSKMWWTKYYTTGRNLDILEYGYLFYLLDHLLNKYNYTTTLVRKTGKLLYEIKDHELFVCNNKIMLHMSMNEFLDYLGNTPFELWGENLEQMALQKEN